MTVSFSSEPSEVVLLLINTERVENVKEVEASPIVCALPTVLHFLALCSAPIDIRASRAYSIN